MRCGGSRPPCSTPSGPLANVARSPSGLSSRVSLDSATKVWLRAVAQAGEVVTFEASANDGAARYLSAFDASLTASGTATLESALAGAPPVIVYKLSAVTAHLAKRLVQTPHVGLPNILLGARHYPELLQGDAEPRQMADALARVLDERPKFASLARRTAAQTSASSGCPRSSRQHHQLGADGELARDLAPFRGYPR